ncbi:MAG: hypothetical protein GXP28_06955 [Planctomycetes bacterium]|nr:hypothetical protein [Planctomycetota bacterium]
MTGVPKKCTRAAKSGVFLIENLSPPPVNGAVKHSENPMTLQTTEQFLFWCMVINVGLMCISFLLLAMLKPMVSRIHSKLFGVSEDYVNRAAYTFLGLYKLMTFFFVIIPWIVLKLIAS